MTNTTTPELSLEMQEQAYVQALTALGLFDRVHAATLSKEGSKELKEAVTTAYGNLVAALKPVQEHLLAKVEAVVERDKKAFETALSNGTPEEKLKYAQTVASLTDKQIEIIRLVVEAVLDTREKK